MSKPPPKPAKPGKSDSVTLCVFYSGPKSDAFPLRAAHLGADVGLMGGELVHGSETSDWFEIKLR